MHGNGTITCSLCQKQLKVIDEESLEVNNWNEVINIFMQNTNYNIKDKSHLSESAKLSYLIGYLRDYALKQVSHLSLTDSNYKLPSQLGL